MSLLPLIQHSRRKTFISPLAGTMLATEQFQSTPKSKLTTVSHLDQGSSPFAYSKIRSTKTQHKLKQSYIEEESTTARKEVERSLKGMKMYHTLDADMVSNSKSIITPRQLQKDPNPNPYFFFPFVQIIPLHLISCHQDIKPKTLTITLEQYFKLFFESKISHKNIQLNHILLKYLPLLKERGMLDAEIAKQKWPAQFWQVQNTNDLLNLLSNYKRKSTYWTNHILVLICLYCLPDKTVRATCLDNLILTINKQLSHRLKIPLSIQELGLFKEDGTPIQDFIQIPFDTKKLYVARKLNGRKEYERFVEMEKQYQYQFKKRGFMGRLRNRFRKEIVPNKLDEASINYNVDFNMIKKDRQSSLQKAMKLLQIKKQKSNNTITALSCQIPLPNSRPKSKEALWKEQNIEDLNGKGSNLSSDEYYFNVNLNNKAIEQQIVRRFKEYNKISKDIDQSITTQQILCGILQKEHQTLKALTENVFHCRKLKTILEIITDSIVPEQHYGCIFSWRNFIQLEILCSKDLRKLVDQPDCYQILRNFTQNYLQMKEQDYFRGELSAKLCRTIEGDSQSLKLMEDVIWTWLEQHGFIRHQAIQREMLWNYPARSKTFYMLITSMVMGTFKTTPLDLAYELLV